MADKPPVPEEPEVEEAKYCEICMEEITPEYKLPENLACGHSFCSVCFPDFLEERINSRRVSAEDLFCPAPSCNRPIEERTLQRNMAPALYDKLTRFRNPAIFEDPANLLENEVGVFCLKCGSVVVMNKTEIRYIQCYDFECIYCKYRFCPQCSRVHTGKTCEEYDRSLMQDIQEQRSQKALRKARKKGYYRQCYKCGQLQHRTKGCNHLTCRSAICKPKTDYCHICEQHCPGRAHLDGDWYGLTCQTLTEDEKKAIRAKGKKFMAILNLLEDGTREFTIVPKPPDNEDKPFVDSSDEEEEAK